MQRVVCVCPPGFSVAGEESGGRRSERAIRTENLDPGNQRMLIRPSERGYGAASILQSVAREGTGRRRRGVASVPRQRPETCKAHPSDWVAETQGQELVGARRCTNGQVGSQSHKGLSRLPDTFHKPHRPKYQDRRRCQRQRPRLFLYTWRPFKGNRWREIAEQCDEKASRMPPAHPLSV